MFREFVKLPCIAIVTITSTELLERIFCGCSRIELIEQSMLLFTPVNSIMNFGEIVFGPPYT